MKIRNFLKILGWSGGAMVLGKLPVPGRPTVFWVVGWCDGAGQTSSAGASY